MIITSKTNFARCGKFANIYVVLTKQQLEILPSLQSYNRGVQVVTIRRTFLSNWQVGGYDPSLVSLTGLISVKHLFLVFIWLLQYLGRKHSLSTVSYIVVYPWNFWDAYSTCNWEIILQLTYLGFPLLKLDTIHYLSVGVIYMKSLAMSDQTMKRIFDRMLGSVSHTLN